MRALEIKAWIAALMIGCTAQMAHAQEWGNLDALLFQNLAPSGTVVGSFWLPNAATPAQATAAIGVVYEMIPGAAGNSGIAVGLFAQQGGAWVFTGKVEGVFGQDPRDAAFSQGFVDGTTSLVGPNDARCCPTLATRWRINLGTRTAVKIN